ncbi:MAG: bifunctional riboflavin kinase/FAD synthetase [Steroidobacteraceae bacterium]
MQLVRGLHNARAKLESTGQGGMVATIGGFDGVHRGHQALLAALKRKAIELALPVAVISFEPSPREFFMGNAAPARLQRFREKFATLAACGVERFVCLRFDERLRSLNATQFAETILRDALGVRWLVVGHDFQFGRGREGDVASLKQLGQQFGFGVDEFAPHLLAEERISSTLVRDALASGDLVRAQQLLGRRYTISGRVVHGKKLGRTLGFPTANMRLQRRVIPLNGIFAVRVSGAGLQSAAAVASLGTRPVVNGVEPLLEVHVFDYDGDLYGQQLEVEFVARLRDELWFPNLDELVAQMQLDATQARQILARY